MDDDKLCDEYENKYHCSECNEKVDALKFTSVNQSPRILIVDFKRYKNGGKKNEKIIEYPSIFSLQKYLSSVKD